MVGQQMLTEARSRNRSARSIALPHPRTYSRHGGTAMAAFVHVFIKPLNALGEAILSKLHVTD